MNTKSVLLVLITAVILFSQIGNAEYTVDEYTVALWHFDEGSGTVIYDETGINNGNLRNGVTFIAETAPINHSSFALYFHGGSLEHVSIPHHTSLDLGNFYTIDFWIKTISSNAMILNKDRIVAGGFGYYVYIDNIGRVVFSKYTGIITSSTPINNGQWTHISIEQDEEGMKIYINDELDAENTNTDLPSNYPESLTLGLEVEPNPQYPLSGLLDELRINNVSRHSASTNIHINSVPSGANVRLDNVFLGVTPITIENVSFGLHSLKLSKELYLDYNTIINVETLDGIFLNITLEPNTLEMRLNNLEQKLADHDARLVQHDNTTVSLLQSISGSINTMMNTFNTFMNKILGYLGGLPPRFHPQMVCNYMKENNITQQEEFGMTCTITNSTCSCKSVDIIFDEK